MRLSDTRTLTNPIWTKASRFLTSRGSLNGCLDAAAARKTPLARPPAIELRLLGYGEVLATFRVPFDMLAETAANSGPLESGVTFKAGKLRFGWGTSSLICGKIAANPVPYIDTKKADTARDTADLLHDEKN